MRPYPFRRPVSALRHQRPRRSRRLWRAGLSVLGVGLLLVSGWATLRGAPQWVRRATVAPPAGGPAPPARVTSPLQAPEASLLGLTTPLQTFALHDRALQTLPPLPVPLTTLDVSGTGLTSLTGLAQLPQLTTLDLSDTGVGNLAALGQLPQLREVHLAGLHLTSVAGLAQLAQLTTLDL